MEVINWHGLYKQGWGKLIVPEAYQHPAKFSRGLIEKIYDFCTEKGYLQRQGTVLDCFGGIGTGGIIAMLKGYNHISVELEEKFCQLARENFKHIEEKYGPLVKGTAVILQGDSRNLRAILGQAQVDGIIASPPYAEDVVHGRPSKMTKKIFKGRVAETGLGDYGTSPGQLGAMAEGDFDAVITSSPFGQAQTGGGIARTGTPEMRKYKNTIASPGYIVSGTSPGQIANLPEGDIQAIITSPAYGKEEHSRWRKQKGWPDSVRNQQAGAGESYGESPGQLGQMKEGNIDAIITSPAWEESMGTKDQQFWDKHNDATSNWHGATRAAADYGTTQGQIGQQSGDTYWDSVAQVYQECFHILKPSGVIVVVVKSFVRNKQLVNLPDMTLKLLEHIGFIPLHYIKAWLVEKGDKQHRLDGGIEQRIKERKGFFRRLHEKKNPGTKIDYEVVLVCRKP